MSAMARGVLADELFFSPVALYVGDAAALHRLEPGDGLQQFLLAAAGDAGDAQYLPGVGG